MADQSSSAGAADHITISYAGFARPWAAWLSHQLEQLGHHTTMLRWDPQADTALAEELSGLLTAEGRLLMVLDDWYFRLGPKTQEEWTAALREVVSPHAERFAAVSVATQSLPATASLLRPADLRDLDATEANRRVLNRLGIPVTGPAGNEDAPGAPRFPNDPPEIWNIPRRNNRFTGRDDALEELYGKLAGSGRNSGPPLETRLALYGISGVGKSQIAAEYAHRFGNDYDVVWWISATNRGAAREQLAELASRLGLPVGQEIGDRIRAVHEALRTGRPYRRWLLIFDSADDMEQIEDLVPDGRGHVLITTLTRDWSGSGSAQEIEVLALHPRRERRLRAAAGPAADVEGRGRPLRRRAGPAAAAGPDRGLAGRQPDAAAGVHRADPPGRAEPGRDPHLHRLPDGLPDQLGHNPQHPARAQPRRRRTAQAVRLLRPRRDPRSHAGQGPPRRPARAPRRSRGRADQLEHGPAAADRIHRGTPGLPGLLGAATRPSRPRRCTGSTTASCAAT